MDEQMGGRPFGRRAALRRIGIVGAVAWSAPAIVSIGAKAAAASPGGCAPVGAPCAFGGDCCSKFCDDGTHTCACVNRGLLNDPSPPCTTNSDCCNDNCVNGLCEPAPFGSPCAGAGGNCQSQYCRDDTLTCG